MQFTTVDRIFAKLYRDIKRDDISESDVIEWIAEAMEFIKTPNMYEPAVAFVEVSNHQCRLPKLFHVLIQIARNNDYEPVTPANLISESTTTEETGDTPVALDETGMPINAYELAYYRPYFDYIGEYYITGQVIGTTKFTPVRLSNHTFFNSVVCRQEGYDDIYASCTDEYTIIENMLRFSFETGQVAISYLKVKVDCNTGYPYVPDHISYTTAITKYVIYKLMERDFYNKREGSQYTLEKAERDWSWYCGQAQNHAKMPQTIDDWENLLRQWNYMIPRSDRYNTFFSKLSKTENRNIIR